MSPISPKIIDVAWRMIPGPLRRRVRSQGGRRLAVATVYRDHESLQVEAEMEGVR